MTYASIASGFWGGVGWEMGGLLRAASSIHVEELVFAPTAEVARERGQNRVTERPLMTTKLE